jgi:exonuclease SbcC
MLNLETASNDILPEKNEKLFCRTIVDLNEIHARLKEFINKNENKRNAISCAMNILNEIELEEKGRVHELFSNEGPFSVSALFSFITGGLYDEVMYDPEGACLNVRHSNGEIINAEKLSGGAYDQLYLAIRLALGDKILNHEKGFFIMDDPFIKSDIKRIEYQIQVLKKIVEIGWQILYFSCKNEIKGILLNDIEKGNIDYFDISTDK